MDLCSRDYAFLFVPGLSIFVNPWSPFSPVTRELHTTSGGGSMDDFRKAHGADATQDLLCRLSSLTHEQKHFHDILFTPYGAHLFGLAIKAVLSATVLFTDSKWRQARVSLPLRPDDVEEPEVLRRTLETVNEFKRALASAKFVLESSATLAQLQYIWTTYGQEHKDLVEQHMSQQPEYSELLDRLERVGRNLLEPEGNFGRMVHRLLLMQLGKVPDEGEPTPDASFEFLLRRLEASPVAESTLQRAVEAGWRVVESNIRQTQRADLADLELVQKVAGRIGSPAGLVGEVYEDFLRVSHKFQDEVLNGAVNYLDLTGYGEPNGHFYKPLLYMYSDDDANSLVHETVPIDDDDLVVHVAYEATDGSRSAYSHRLYPAKGWNETTRLNKKAWVTFLKSIAAVTCLVEFDLNWRHPVVAYWLRSMGQELGVTFTRRM